MLPATPLFRPAQATPLYAAPLFCQQAALFPANQLSRPAQADVLHAWPHSIHNGHKLQPHGLILCLSVIEWPAAQFLRPPCSERTYVFVTRVLSTTENLAVICPQGIIADHDCSRASGPESAPCFSSLAPVFAIIGPSCQQLPFKQPMLSCISLCGHYEPNAASSAYVAPQAAATAAALVAAQRRLRRQRRRLQHAADAATCNCPMFRYECLSWKM